MKDSLSSRVDFYLILALAPRNGLGYCVVNGHKVIGNRIIVITINNYYMASSASGQYAANSVF